MGSDTPELDQARLEQDFLRLAAGEAAGAPAGATAVPGPATDGGYYLLGLSRFSRAPFIDIAFGGAEAAAQTVSVLEHAGYAVSLRDSLSDLDARADLVRVAARLCHRGRPGEQALRALMLAILAAARPPLPRPAHRLSSSGSLRREAAHGPPAR